MTNINMDEVALLVEIPSVYDGWSVAEMKDGSLVNRWDEDDPRYLPTEDFIDGMIADRWEQGQWECDDLMGSCIDCTLPTHIEYERCPSCECDDRDSVS